MRMDASHPWRRGRGVLAVGFWLAGVLLAPAAPARCADVPAAPETIAELWSRGETAFRTGNLDEALRLFEAALARDELRARSWNYVGGAHFEKGDLTRALAAFRQAHALDPNDVRACNNLGTALERGGDYAGAEQAYRQALAVDPSHLMTLRNLGILQARRLQDPEAARKTWLRYLALAPSGAHADELRSELATLDAEAPAAPHPR